MHITDEDRRRVGPLLRRYMRDDPDFDAKIRNLRPDWCEDKHEIVKRNQNILLEMIKAGKPRPSQHAKDPEIKRLGILLTTYTREQGLILYPEFNKNIRQEDHNGTWFRPSINFADKVNAILKLNKKPSAISKDPVERRLGKTITFILSPKGRLQYPDLYKKIINKWPKKMTSAEKKEILRRMAKNKEQVPPPKSVLGNALRNYINPKSSSYNGDFANDIKDWFTLVNQSTKSKDKKRELIALHDDGQPRPKKSSQFGRAHRRYSNTASQCYDKEYVRSTPNWI